MSARQVGIAPYRLHEHPRAAEIDATARWVLTVMAMFVGSGERHAANPTCFASQAAIAERAAASVTTVGRAQKRLRKVGLIEHAGRVGEGVNCTVRWRLTLLTESRPLSVGSTDKEEHPDSTRTAVDGAAPLSVRSTDKGGARGPRGGSVRSTDKHSVRSTDKHSVRSTDYPSDLLRPSGSKERGGSDVADAPPSAGATGVAAPSSTGDEPSTGVLGEIADALGWSSAAAEAWAGRKLGAATGPVRNESAFLRACLAAELAQRAAPSASARKAPASGKGRGSAKGRKAPKGRPSAAQRAAALGAATRPHYAVRKAQQAEALAASRAGEAHQRIAERLNVTVLAVDQCRQQADGDDAVTAFRAGEAPGPVAERLGLDPGTVDGWHSRFLRDQARRAARAPGPAPSAIGDATTTPAAAPAAAEYAPTAPQSDPGGPFGARPIDPRWAPILAEQTRRRELVLARTASGQS